eukprot:7380735-Prymnesium_polylepis.3
MLRASVRTAILTAFREEEAHHRTQLHVFFKTADIFQIVHVLRQDIGNRETRAQKQKNAGPEFEFRDCYQKDASFWYQTLELPLDRRHSIL